MYTTIKVGNCSVFVAAVRQRQVAATLDGKRSVAMFIFSTMPLYRLSIEVDRDASFDPDLVIQRDILRQAVAASGKRVSIMIDGLSIRNF
ncbi:MAG: hypothetical protein U0N04_07295 [Oscillospiraceae bacterium]